MHHVFVETNWVVAYAAPAYLRMPAALALSEKAAAGEISLHLPAICLSEARGPIRSKAQPRMPADYVRSYLAWAKTEGKLSTEDDATVRRVLDQYESQFAAEVKDLDERLALLRQQPGIEIFGLTETMLERAVGLSVQNLDLDPFDQAILAAVLVRASELRLTSAENVSFGELDQDLQPWDKIGRRKEPLRTLYDFAQVSVYGNFSMQAQNPGRPDRPLPHTPQS
jgi:hypothetical protein